MNSHLLLSLSYGASPQVEAPTNSTLATRFEFHPAISSPLILLTTPGSGIRKRLHHKAHLIFWSSTLAVPHFVLNMAKRPQEMQVYTRRDVFAPPNTSYINQVFQPEHGRERWCDDSQEASVIGCQRLLRIRPGWFFGAMQSASFPSFNQRLLHALPGQRVPGQAVPLAMHQCHLFRPTGSLHSDPTAVCII